ncbi:MAG: ATP synthase subunit I [Methylovirgula sp.]
MNALAPAGISALLVIEAVAAFVAGAGAGIAHFGLLRKNVDLFLSGGSAMRAVVLQIGRLAVTGLTLYVAVRFGGVLVLLAALAGFLSARQLMLRQIGGA